MINEDLGQDECDFYGFDKPVGGLKQYGRGESELLCPLCGSLYVRNYIQFGWRENPHARPAVQAICFAGNQLRRDLANGNHQQQRKTS
jgi:hypothetical protein